MDGERIAGEGHALSPLQPSRGSGPTAYGRAFFERRAEHVAPELIGATLRSADGRRARIVEVEAYGGADDPASHAFRGRSARNASMWGPPGHLYVYFTYGMHWCANVVCAPAGEPAAVLLRAAEPTGGLEAMRAARWSDQRRQIDRDLCRGPGRLARAFGLDRGHDGTDLLDPDGLLALVPTPTAALRSARAGGSAAEPSDGLRVTERIGVRVGRDLRWRWYEGGSPWRSGPP